MNLGACSSLRTGPEHTTWYRAIEPGYWATALGAAHTIFAGSRFSPATSTVAAFPLLYFAENQLVALFEVGAMLGSPWPGGVVVPNTHLSWALINVQITLQCVADLCEAAEQTKLATTAQELTGDWRAYRMRTFLTSASGPKGPAPTQDLGEALYNLPGLEGFRTPSARAPHYRNLVVFPSKLRSGSRIVFTDAATGQTHTIP